jgi:hypothetical protein
MRRASRAVLEQGRAPDAIFNSAPCASSDIGELWTFARTRGTARTSWTPGRRRAGRPCRRTRSARSRRTGRTSGRAGIARPSRAAGGARRSRPSRASGRPRSPWPSRTGRQFARFRCDRRKLQMRERRGARVRHLQRRQRRAGVAGRHGALCRRNRRRRTVHAQVARV